MRSYKDVEHLDELSHYLPLKDGLVYKQDHFVEALVLLYTLTDISLICFSHKAQLPSEAYRSLDEYVYPFCTFGQGGGRRPEEHILLRRHIKYAIVPTGFSEEKWILSYFLSCTHAL